MPRGNDSAAALADLRGEFAGAGGSAEDLIASSRSAIGPDLRTANNIARDTEYDDNLGKDRLVAVDVEKVQDEVGDEGVVLSAAKRGPYVVAVVEAESGRTFKVALAAEKVGFDKSRERPSLRGSDEEHETTDVLRERMRGMADAKRIEREAEEAAREAREKVIRSYQQKAESDSGKSADSGSSQGSGQKQAQKSS